jgi:lipopolysaccharide/colanic/teichoic acid biosynthesis glycosyltransferase
MMDHGLPLVLREAPASQRSDDVDVSRNRDKSSSDTRPSAKSPELPVHGAGAVGSFAMGARGVLQGAEWVRQLELEKRRADRSKSPLSIALFRFDASETSDQRLSELIELLCAKKRETDYVGCVGDTLVAVLLPDTTEHGAHRFVAKIQDTSSDSALTSCVETYPDRSLLDVKDIGARAAVQPPQIEARPLEHACARCAKRAMDLVGALLGLVVLAPVMAVVALAIKADSPGPVFYRQTRLGRGARPFTFYKFRSMYRDSDERVHREYVTRLITGDGEASSQKPWSKLEDDARITIVGRFLRKTCLDELPQLLNVLKGDLSLVGPRPPLPYEAAAYESWHLRRVLEAKPGITGLWQVSRGSVATFDDMVRMDLRYVRRWSLLLDCRILIQTVVLVLRKRGGG